MDRTFRRVLPVAGILAIGLLSGCGDPDSRAAKYVKHGEELVASGQPDKARLEFRNAIKIKPTLAEPYYQVGLLDEAGGNLQNAFDDYSQAELQDPHHAGALVKLAGFYFGAERFDEAQKRLDTVVQDNPEDAGALALNAAIKLRHQDIQGAQADVTKALKNAPNNVPAISVQVGISDARGDLNGAAAALEDGIKRNPQDTSLLALKVGLFKKHNLPDKVAEAYQQIFTMHPAERSFRAEAAAYFTDLADLTRAEQVLRDGVAAMPDDMEMKRLLISFLDLKRGIGPAEQELHALITAEPNNDRYLFWLTDLYVRHNDSARAVTILNQIVTQSGSEESAMTARAALARISFANGDQAAAEQQLATVLAKRPNNQDALFLRAAINNAQGLYQVAITDLRSLLRDHPRNPEASQLLAEALVKVGHVDLAADTLAEVLEAQPGNHVIEARLAQLYHVSGDEKRSDMLLQAVTTEAPDYAPGWESQARIALDRKDWALADQAIRRLEQMPGQGAAGAYLRGMWLLAQSQWDTAATKFADILNNGPAPDQMGPALSALIEAERQRGHLESAVAFIKSLKANTPSVHAALADCYLALQQVDAAATEYDDAINLIMAAASPAVVAANSAAPAGDQESTRNADVFVARARIYIVQGRSGDAEAVLRKAVTAVPGDLRPRLLLANVVMQRGDHVQAIALYEDILARNPDVQVAANNYAELIADYRYQDGAALEKARQIADRFQASDDPALLDTVAWIYYRLGQFQTAASFMQRVMANADVTPQMRYHYAAVLLKQGNKQEAEVELKKATASGASYPGFDDAKLMLSQM
ncbi:MAG TPA: tetratricopeptide repeat protein [Terriglobales bacterium]|nr:tetratricopeptide repeat protein [Terriglobales bacterium]